MDRIKKLFFNNWFTSVKEIILDNLHNYKLNENKFILEFNKIENNLDYYINFLKDEKLKSLAKAELEKIIWNFISKFGVKNEKILNKILNNIYHKGEHDYNWNELLKKYHYIEDVICMFVQGKLPIENKNKEK